MAERGNGQAARESEREEEGGRASEHHSARSAVAVQQSTQINTPPFPFSSPSLSLCLAWTRAHTGTHARTHALLVTGTQECRGSAVCSRSSSSSSSLSRKTRFFPSSELDPSHPHPPLVHESKSSRQEPPPPPIYEPARSCKVLLWKASDAPGSAALLPLPPSLPPRLPLLLRSAPASPRHGSLSCGGSPADKPLDKSSVGSP